MTATTFIANPFIYDARRDLAQELIEAANANGAYTDEQEQNRAARRIVAEAEARGVANPFIEGLIHIN